jgi:hypothetical protein
VTQAHRVSADATPFPLARGPTYNRAERRRPRLRTRRRGLSGRGDLGCKEACRAGENRPGLADTHHASNPHLSAGDGVGPHAYEHGGGGGGGCV